MAIPAYDYQQLAQAMIANVGAAGVAPGAGAANAVSTAHYSGDHMDIERIESSMTNFLSDSCVVSNATVLHNIRTFIDHVSNVFNDQVVLYETRDDMERLPPDAVDTNAFSSMVTQKQQRFAHELVRLFCQRFDAEEAAILDAETDPSRRA